MDRTSQEFIRILENDISNWEEAAKFWEDPRVIGLKDICGSRCGAQELAAMYRERARTCREMADRVKKENQ